MIIVNYVHLLFYILCYVSNFVSSFAAQSLVHRGVVDREEQGLVGVHSFDQSNCLHIIY